MQISWNFRKCAYTFAHRWHEVSFWIVHDTTNTKHHPEHDQPWGLLCIWYTQEARSTWSTGLPWPVNLGWGLWFQKRGLSEDYILCHYVFSDISCNVTGCQIWQSKQDLHAPWIINLQPLERLRKKLDIKWRGPCLACRPRVWDLCIRVLGQGGGESFTHLQFPQWMSAWSHSETTVHSYITLFPVSLGNTLLTSGQCVIPGADSWNIPFIPAKHKMEGWRKARACMLSLILQHVEKVTIWPVTSLYCKSLERKHVLMLWWLFQLFLLLFLCIYCSTRKHTVYIWTIYPVWNIMKSYI